MHENQQPQTEVFGLSVAEREATEHEIHHYEDLRATFIKVLKIVQKQYGWVSDGAIHTVVDMLGTPAGDVEGVAAFYSQIFRQPVGRHMICYCGSVVCHINGYQDIQAALEKKLSIRPGQTTFDGRSMLLSTCCPGNCDKGPNIMIDEDTHAHLAPETIPGLLERYR